MHCILLFLVALVVTMSAARDERRSLHQVMLELSMLAAGEGHLSLHQVQNLKFGVMEGHPSQCPCIADGQSRAGGALAPISEERMACHNLSGLLHHCFWCILGSRIANQCIERKVLRAKNLLMDLFLLHINFT
ncbi:uncharacterized protein LOC144822215 isoform X2 [Lissotriton helveticus]